MRTGTQIAHGVPHQKNARKRGFKTQGGMHRVNEQGGILRSLTTLIQTAEGVST